MRFLAILIIFPLVFTPADETELFQYADFSLQIPSTWTELPTRKLAKYAIDKELKQYITFYYFGSTSMNEKEVLDSNLVRWKKQFSKLEQEQEIKLKNENVVARELTGTFNKRLWPMARKKTPVPNYGALVAIIHSFQGPFFIRLEASKEIVAKEKTRFIAFLNSYSKVADINRQQPPITAIGGAISSTSQDPHGHDHTGHDHEGHDHKGHDHEGHDHKGHDHEGHDHKGHDHEGHDHKGHDHEGHDHKGHDHSDHANEKDKSVAHADFAMILPKSWVKTKSKSKMRIAEYVLKQSSPHRVIVYNFGSTGQTREQVIAENVARWKKQFIKVEDSKNIPLAVKEPVLVQITGLFEKKPFPMAPKGVPTKDYALLMAIVPSSKGPFFFRLEVPKAIAKKELNNFVAFLNSYKKK